MKKNKGFTLIELLAVIVILAIIALIATPMIMDVIDKARKGAAENAALGYVEGIEKYAVYGMIDNVGEINFDAGIYQVTDTKLAAIDYKGDKPSEGWVAVDSKGNVTAAFLKFNSYSSYVGYTNEKHAQAIFTDKDTFKDIDVSTPDKAKTEMNRKLKPIEETDPTVPVPGPTPTPTPVPSE